MADKKSKITKPRKLVKLRSPPLNTAAVPDTTLADNNVCPLKETMVKKEPADISVCSPNIVIKIEKGDEYDPLETPTAARVNGSSQAGAVNVKSEAPDGQDEVGRPDSAEMVIEVEPTMQRPLQSPKRARLDADTPEPSRLQTGRPVRRARANKRPRAAAESSAKDSSVTVKRESLSDERLDVHQLPDGEVSDSNQWHLKRWLGDQTCQRGETTTLKQECLQPLWFETSIAGTSGSPVAGPSCVSAGIAAPSLVDEDLHCGSELDVEYDDESDGPDLLEGVTHCGGQESNGLDEEGENLLAETDLIVDAAHSGLPGVHSRFDWSEDYSTFGGRREVFTLGLERTESYSTPYDAFVAIWDEGIMKHIAAETNRYAWQTISGKVERGELKLTTRLNEWVETDVDELYVLFGLFIIMGYSPRLRLDDYWSTSEFMHTPGFRNVMSYNRHVLLNKFLHFVDNQNYVSRNDAKLSKLKPIIDHCNAKFESLYELGEYISIDESLTLSKGRISWAQRIATKAAQFGRKSFELRDSLTGYLWRFAIYTGKDSTQSYDLHIKELAVKSTEIVLHLLEGLEGKGYYLTMDDFYNSPVLARYLKSRGFDCVGTLRVQRKNVPDAIKLQQSAKPGAILACHSGDVSVLSWKDSKVVTTISTFHDAQTCAGTKGGKAHIRPVVARDYNMYMGSVERKDKRLSTYLGERKRCLKWYMKMFRRLLNASVHNAYILHCRTLKRNNEPVMGHRRFRELLAETLVKQHKTWITKISQSHCTEKRLRRDIVHIPFKSDRLKRRRCARCSALGICRKVQSLCETCEVGLCYKPCWEEYHSESDLSVRRTDDYFT